MKKNHYYINAMASIHPDGVIGEDNILRAVEPDYKDIIPANARRRMSRIVKMGVACGLDCIARNEEVQIDAIITATGLGCLTDTEKFLNLILDNDEQLLNPTAFIQSTFNVIGAQIALLSGNHSYNNTYVHRGLSFESALIDAMMRLSEGDRNVLVGAADEAIVSECIILERLQLLDNITLGEGAQFFTLSSQKNGNAHAELLAVDMFFGEFEEGQILSRINNFLNRNNINKEQIGHLLTGRNGHRNQDRIYDKVEQFFTDVSVYIFKNVSGEYPTASAFAFWMAAGILKEMFSDDYLLIYNHYNYVNHSLILLKRC